MVHVRHPLVRIAVEEIQADGLALRRFGHVALSASPSQQYIALLSLIEGKGIRRFLRLEPTIVDLSGTSRPRPGRRVAPRLRDRPHPRPGVAHPANVEELLWLRRRRPTQPGWPPNVSSSSTTPRSWQADERR